MCYPVPPKAVFRQAYLCGSNDRIHVEALDRITFSADGSLAEEWLSSFTNWMPDPVHPGRVERGENIKQPFLERIPFKRHKTLPISVDSCEIMTDLA